MSSWREALLAALLLVSVSAIQAQQRFPGIGRAATPAEVKAWDIDVRPDFRGLPPGSGSVAQGMQVWEGKCASCHGVFGESNEVFSPLVGGTTDNDIRTGRVANLRRPDYPGRTTLMKVPHLSTLWDYINRAMPWNAPKSLGTDEVYAVTAYMLNLGRIVPDSFVLSNRNMAEVQKRVPNRNGMTTAHAMWPGRELGGVDRPDISAVACMTNCPVDPTVTSAIPDHARNAHGNLAEQNRLVGPQRGVDTTRAGGAPAGAQPVATPSAAASPTALAKPVAASQTSGATQTNAAAQLVAAGPAHRMPADLLQRNTCTACHAPDRPLIGPSWSSVAKKHAGKAEYLAARIRAGSSGVWGSVPMPPQTISLEEAGKIADWLAGGAAP